MLASITTPGARIQAAIELPRGPWQTAEGAPADVVAGAYFKSRRYIGLKDRAARRRRLYYGVLRRRAQLDWWLARATQSAAAPWRRAHGAM